MVENENQRRQHCGAEDTENRGKKKPLDPLGLKLLLNASSECRLRENLRFRQRAVMTALRAFWRLRTNQPRAASTDDRHFDYTPLPVIRLARAKAMRRRFAPTG